ncbi:hypothetical protein WA1_24685 [Scytonema hofmannii PCC 7110]|uniref:DUF1822 domain-containing protein n=1 Tax=Scytonema hofmannii PCC 7110 TaxID=128403 RepID=A0A139X863_9CYAN|nr:DUF1822 family protein [Scytonema hofmannii]KYC40822.1 hypothetical protein WA1_24685 [Scytonema hofmannii PCC 7110]
MAGITDEMFERTVVLPITKEAHYIACQLADVQLTPQKAEQVRLNTLAVTVVNNYLQMMDIPTDVSASYSRKPFMLMFNDVADLVIPEAGRLECRPVKANAETCYFPLEVWNDRIGYIAVQMDEALKEAALVGFTPKVETEELLLEQFQPLQDFLQYINQLLQGVVALSSVDAVQLTNLSQWLQDIFEPGWQTLHSLMKTSQANLAYGGAWRSTKDSATSNEDTQSNTVKRVKVINLNTPQGNYSVVLEVSITPDYKSVPIQKEQETNICLRIKPAVRQTFLPLGLEMMILDDKGDVFDRVQAAREFDYIQLQIGGHPEERFSVRVALDDTNVTEDFII